MDPAKKSRIRVPNFTPDEKAFLAQLIRKRPIIESKQTDGKSLEKKKNAWELITVEFNSNFQVHKRNTLTLKRAWDNMKAVARKARAAQRGNLIRTVGGLSNPPQPPQQEVLLPMLEEAAPMIKYEVDIDFDSDGTILHKTEEPEPESELQPTCTVNQTSPRPKINRRQQDQPTDCIRREAILRLKHLEYKKKMDIRILKTKLEVQEIKKRSALLEEETKKILLEKTKLEIIDLNNKREREQ